VVLCDDNTGGKVREKAKGGKTLLPGKKAPPTVKATAEGLGGAEETLMGKSKQYRTKAGVLVEQRGEAFVTELGLTKIQAYRVKTGGFHGILRLDHLTPVDEDRLKEKRMCPDCDEEAEGVCSECKGPCCGDCFKDIHLEECGIVPMFEEFE
jgi:hypothetical protein